MNEYNPDERKILLQTARESIAYGLKHKAPMAIRLADYSAHLQQIRACFVSIHLNGDLRGCIGSLMATQPLIVNIAQNAFNAAFADPRFTPLTQNEFSNIALDISVLSLPTPMPITSEADLLNKLQPHVHGLILSDQGQRATFLPVVWEQLPDPAEFVRHLKNKAGWPNNYWSTTIQVETYTAEFIA